jgi:four helix bundle protein
MQFDAYQVSLELVRSLRAVLPQIRRGNPSLATQLDRAAPSIALNLSEGRRRTGKDRVQLWKIAAGSADEVRAGLEVAEASGYVTMAEIEPLRGLIDRILAMTYRMTH